MARWEVDVYNQAIGVRNTTVNERGNSWGNWVDPINHILKNEGVADTMQVHLVNMEEDVVIPRSLLTVDQLALIAENDLIAEGAEAARAETLTDTGSATVN